MGEGNSISFGSSLFLLFDENPSGHDLCHGAFAPSLTGANSKWRWRGVGEANSKHESKLEIEFKAEQWPQITSVRLASMGPPAANPRPFFLAGVDYLPVVHPLKSKNDSVAHFAERTSNAMSSSLNVIQTSHAYGDIMIVSKAAEQADCSNYMVVMGWAKNMFDVNTSEALEHLDQFLAVDPDPNGRVGFHEFSNAFGLGYSPQSEKTQLRQMRQTIEVLFTTVIIASIEYCYLLIMEQLQERDKYILDMEMKHQDKDRELHALQLDNEAVCVEKNCESRISMYRRDQTYHYH